VEVLAHDGTDRPTAMHIHGNLGVTLLEQGRLDEAEDELRTALDGLDATVGPRHPSVGRVRRDLGRVLLARGRPAAAEAELLAALEILRASLPADHPALAQVEARIDEVERP